jgi:hypothetical protein
MNSHSHLSILSLIALAGMFFGAGCTALKDTSATPSPAAAAGQNAALVTMSGSPMDLGFLLSMSFSEAKSFSTQQLEIPPHIKIAADSIHVFKYADDGKARKARARGKVFIEMNFKESAKALCQEAYITEDEIILRGKPVLQRGGSMVEGLDDSTIFYLFGTSLRVIGLHKVNNQTEMTSVLPLLGDWAEGPNPLLPPLSESSVPGDIRSEMQRAAEAELLHQKTRELYGPANAPADSPPPTPPPAAKPAEKTKTSSPPATAKKPPAVEIRRAIPNKKSFWSRFRTDKTRA